MAILLEYIIVFLAVFIIQYFIFSKDKKEENKKKKPAELLYLEKIYHINIKNIDTKKFSYTCSLLNTFIISNIYMILMYLLTDWVIRIVLGIILLILMMIICYGLLGRYYLKKEGK